VHFQLAVLSDFTAYTGFVQFSDLMSFVHLIKLTTGFKLADFFQTTLHIVRILY